MNLLSRLLSNQQRGSKPRCHLLTHGSNEAVAERLTSLIDPWGRVNAADRWMPVGFESRKEAQLHTATIRLNPSICATLAQWWLPEDRLDARTPNWDIVSTCTIESRPGLLLVEAKAHESEFTNEAIGRVLKSGDKGDQEARNASHKTIGAAIEEARAGLCTATGLEWKISRDSHYQLSNRFAWAWKVAVAGLPVVLVYLGFLNADEMTDQGAPLRSTRGGLHPRRAQPLHAR